MAIDDRNKPNPSEIDRPKESPQGTPQRDDKGEFQGTGGGRNLDENSSRNAPGSGSTSPQRGSSGSGSSSSGGSSSGGSSTGGSSSGGSSTGGSSSGGSSSGSSSTKNPNRGGSTPGNR